MSETPKSCADCIFNLDEADQRSAIRQSVGARLCGAGEGPTTLPEASDKENAALQKRKAANCGKFSAIGLHRDPGIHSMELAESRKLNADARAMVALPDPRVLDRPELGNGKGIVSNCMQCANYVPPEETVGAGLWNAGLCSARGVIIPTVALSKAAEECDSNTIGARFEDPLDRMQLIPAYKAVTIGELLLTDEVVTREEDDEDLIDPQEYETDKPVSEADQVAGIRAWREIVDEDSGNSVHLPIYDINFFDAELQEAVPRAGDDEHPERYIDHQGLVYKTAVLWLHLDETPALWGVAGTGKTEFYRHMAYLMGLPFHRISVTGSTEVEDLAGKMHYSPERGTYFEYGRVPNAWTKPGVICLDEPNVGPPDVWQFIRPLTDNSKQLVLDMNDGERISRHPSAHLGLAMNPAWDVRNSGTEALADADGSRLMHIFVDMPTAEVERQIILERCALDGYELPAENLKAIMSIAAELRKLCEADTLPITWGVRPQIKVARALRWFSMSDAYRLATADYLEPEQQEIILDVVKAHTPQKKREPFGGEVKKGEAPTSGGASEKPKRSHYTVSKSGDRKDPTITTTTAGYRGAPAEWRHNPRHASKMEFGDSSGSNIRVSRAFFELFRDWERKFFAMRDMRPVLWNVEDIEEIFAHHYRTGRMGAPKILAKYGLRESPTEEVRSYMVTPSEPRPVRPHLSWTGEDAESAMAEFAKRYIPPSGVITVPRPPDEYMPEKEVPL